MKAHPTPTVTLERLQYGTFVLRDEQGNLVMDGSLPLMRSGRTEAEREAEFIEQFRRQRLAAIYPDDARCERGLPAHR
jgi:hypothetical protein